MAYTVLIRLVGNQSWGVASLGNIRDTFSVPIKSGVTGLYACALGIPRNGDISELAKLKFGTRVDKPGKKRTELQVAQIKGCESNISHRDYLEDAWFIVGAECETKEMAEKLAHALEVPEWDIFLGRKTFIPRFPDLLIGIREKPVYDALYDEDWLLATHNPSNDPKLVSYRLRHEFRYTDKLQLRILVEDEDAATLVKGQPISYNSKRREHTYMGLKEMPPRIISKADFQKKEEEEECTTSLE